MKQTDKTLRRNIGMKKIVCLLLAILFCVTLATACADAYDVPLVNSSGPSYGTSNSGYVFPGIQAKMIDKLATRSGPSTEYTACGQIDLRGSYVTVYSLKYDINGVPWVEVEINAGGLRRVWTGAKRLDLNDNQLRMLPMEDGSFLGYGQFVSGAIPRSGPGAQYSIVTELTFAPGNQVAVLKEQNGFYLTECRISSGEKLRSWVPVDVFSALTR